MSAIEETKREISVPKTSAREAAAPSFITRVLDLLSSVRFGVTLLVLLAAACMTGMLIMQQNVEGFDRYYAELSPAQKMLGGALGFFDIYHVWYFNALLLVLSLNIVLASIDRFPKAWTFISRKKLDASAHWLKGQEQHASVVVPADSRSALAEHVAAAFRQVGLKKPLVTEKGGKTFVFGERGTYNRLAAYAVHVALLTIFLGGFLTGMFGHTGQMPLKPGAASNTISETAFQIDPSTKEFAPHDATFELPFEVECTDIQQKLIKKEGPITQDNTLDWLTYVKFKDPVRGEREALVHLNAPVDYGGYRFFQASFIAQGKARQITLRVTPEGGGAAQDVTIKRDGSAALADGTRIDFKDFSGSFKLGAGQPQDEDESGYANPAATLAVVPPGAAAAVQAFAFSPEMAARAPIAKRPVAGYTYRLIDFEKAPAAHILSVQRDPGATLVYVGFTMLAMTLVYAFFFSHQRVWALVEERGRGTFEVTLGGNTNRNKLAFEDRFKRLKSAIDGQPIEVKES